MICEIGDTTSNNWPAAHSDLLDYLLGVQRRTIKMESSTYGSAHLPSPALVVFSQAAGGLGEALRIQRPFHSQVRNHKEYLIIWCIWADSL